MSRKISDKECLNFVLGKMLAAPGALFDLWQIVNKDESVTGRQAIDAAILSARRSKKGAR